MGNGKCGKMAKTAFSGNAPNGKNQKIRRYEKMKGIKTMKEIKNPEILTLSSVDDEMDVENIDTVKMWDDINKQKNVTNVDKLCVFCVNAVKKHVIKKNDPVAEKLDGECKTARFSSVYKNMGVNSVGMFDDFCSVAKLVFLKCVPIDTPADELERIASEILASVKKLGDGKHEEQRKLVNKMKNAVLSECRKMATRSRSDSLEQITLAKLDKDDTLNEENDIEHADDEQENTLTAVEEQSHFSALQASIIERLQDSKMKPNAVHAYKIFMCMPSATFETIARIFSKSEYGKGRTDGANLIFVKRSIHKGNEILRSLTDSVKRSERIHAIMCEKH